MSSRFHAGVQHSQFGQHDRPIWHCALQRLSQPSEAAIGDLNIPRGLSQRFGCSGAFAAAFPQASSPRGKGVWLFPPLGSPAFPSGVGPLVSLLPAKAIRAVGVCVVQVSRIGDEWASVVRLENRHIRQPYQVCGAHARGARQLCSLWYLLRVAGAVVSGCHIEAVRILVVRIYK